MSEAEDAAQAILGLVVGGIILVSVGSTLNQVSIVDLEKWGILFLVVAVVLTVLLVVTGIIALINKL